MRELIAHLPYFVRMVAKEALRPLVDPGSVLFGNCVPVKVLGYSIEPPAAASAPPRES